MACATAQAYTSRGGAGAGTVDTRESCPQPTSAAQTPVAAASQWRARGRALGIAGADDILTVGTLRET